MTALTRDQRAVRGALIQESYRRDPARGWLAAIEEGARQFRTGKRPSPAAAPAIPPKVIAEAVAVALAAQKTVRKARKSAGKAAARAATEAATARMLQERQQLAAQFSETALGASLREASNADLAVITTTALSGTGQPDPPGRSVVVMTVRPEALSLEDLGIAAAAGSAGTSPFWAGQTGGESPFWRSMQAGGASKGTAGA